MNMGNFMRLLVCGVLLTAALSLSQAAKADWQYTKWGMSPDQVVSASAGAVSRSTSSLEGPNGTALLASGTYAVVPGFIAEATFGFTNGGLSAVQLKFPTDGKCYAIGIKLTEQYGRADDAVDLLVSTKKTWNDTASGNKVVFNRFSESCYLTYQPINFRPKSSL